MSGLLWMYFFRPSSTVSVPKMPTWAKLAFSHITRLFRTRKETPSESLFWTTQSNWDDRSSFSSSSSSSLLGSSRAKVSGGIAGCGLTGRDFLGLVLVLSASLLAATVLRPPFLPATAMRPPFSAAGGGEGLLVAAL